MNLFKFVVLFAVFLISEANIWMNIDVKKIDRKQCIVDDASWGSESAGCSKLTYMTIDERILPSHERRSTSFEHISGSSRPTVTHWPRGKLSDWMMSIQFISVDPVYGIARTCDRSGYVRVFQDIGDNNQFSENTVKIEGQCFTAVVHIQASTDICPWCIEEASNSAPTTTTIAPPKESASSQFLLISMLFLTLVSVAALFGVGVLLILYIVDRREPTLPTQTATLPVYELPQPTVSRCGSFVEKQGYLSSPPSTWTTRTSGGNWGEYGQDQWMSYQLQKNQMFLNERQVYQDISEYCSSPDSGRDTL